MRNPTPWSLNQKPEVLSPNPKPQPFPEPRPPKIKPLNPRSLLRVCVCVCVYVCVFVEGEGRGCSFRVFRVRGFRDLKPELRTLGFCKPETLTPWTEALKLRSNAKTRLGCIRVWLYWKPKGIWQTIQTT